MTELTIRGGIGVLDTPLTLMQLIDHLNRAAMIPIQSESGRESFVTPWAVTRFWPNDEDE